MAQAMATLAVLIVQDSVRRKPGFADALASREDHRPA
jgi:hypothetical protein